MPKAKDVIGYAKDKNVSMVDLKFMDFLGLWQHFTIPLAELTEGVSRKAWASTVFDPRLDAHHNSDMLVVPDSDTGCWNPFMKDTTLSLLCNIVDPITKEPYRATRARRPEAEKYLRASGIGDVRVLSGPRPNSSSSTAFPNRQQREHAHYQDRIARGPVETGSAVEHSWDGKTYTARRTSATSRATRKATSRSRPSTRSRTAQRMCRVMEQGGHPGRAPHTRWPPPDRRRSTSDSNSLVKTADKLPGSSTW